MIAFARLDLPHFIRTSFLSLTIMVCGVLMLISFANTVNAQQRPPAPAAPSRVCHFDCIEQYNVWGPSASGRTCNTSCMLSRIRPVNPQTATAESAHACTTDAGCVEHCNAVCVSQGGRCFMGTSVPVPNCGTPPNGCAELSSRSDPSGDLNGTTPTCFTLPSTGGTARPAAGGTGTSRGSSVVLHNPLGDGSTFTSIIARVIKGVIGIVGSIALLMFVYGGIRYMTSGGSEEGVKESKAILKNATIGLLLIFFSYTLITIFLSAFNQPINSTSATSPTPTSAPPS